MWLWERAGDGTVSVQKVISIPAEPAEADQLPPLLQPFGAVPPLITDISLSVDDQDLYVSCWGTGELKRFDVSDPRAPRETGSVRLGGIVSRAAHPASGPLNGGPQMVETSRDGKRIFLTNSLYAAWDAQFYPEGIDGWFVKLDAGADGSLTVDPDVFVPYSGERPHQVRLSGGDASSDSYCFPEWVTSGPMSCWACSAPTTGSTPRWAGCSRSRWGCRSVPGAPCCARWCRSRSATRRRSCSWRCSWSASGCSPTRTRCTSAQGSR